MIKTVGRAASSRTADKAPGRSGAAPFRPTADRAADEVGTRQRAVARGGGTFSIPPTPTLFSMVSEDNEINALLIARFDPVGEA